MTAVRAPHDTIRIAATTRWDALDLAGRLFAFHTYLVQLGDARWLVCVRPDGGAEVVADVREVAEAWAAERSLESVLSVGGETYPLRHH